MAFDQLSATEKFIEQMRGLSERHKTKLCWFWHSWGSWSIVARAKIVVSSDKRYIGDSMTQERVCLTCRLTQQKQTKTTIFDA